MAKYVKQGAQQTIMIGPFVDDADGKTPKTGLTITASEIWLAIAGGDPWTKIDSSSAVHKNAGHYSVTLGAADTGNTGKLRVMVNKAGALPVWDDYVIIPQQVYNSLVSGTDLLDVMMGGIGTYATELTIESPAGYPVDGAEVWATTDEAGNNTVAVGITNASGKVTMYLDEGYYYVWVQAAGHTFDNPTPLTVPET